MKASLISQLKGILSDEQKYSQLDPTNTELKDLIYSLGDIDLKKLYLINVVADFLYKQLYTQESIPWSAIHKVLQIHQNLQTQLFQLCQTDADKAAFVRLTFLERFQYSATALENNHILLFYFFKNHRDLFHNIHSVNALASDGLVQSLSYILDALDLDDKEDFEEYTKALGILIGAAKSQNNERFIKLTSEEAIARYRSGTTVSEVDEEEFVPRSTEFTKRLLAGAAKYFAAENTRSTTLDEWWDSLHPFDIKIYKRLKSMDTDNNKLSDKFLKEKVIHYLRTMAVFDAEVFKYFKQHYEIIFKEIILEALQGNPARVYILKDLGINLDFTGLALSPNDYEKFASLFFSIEAILFYIKGVKFDDLLNLVRRDGAIVLDDEALENFKGFVNLDVYKLISYSNAYELLYALYNNTAFKGILFADNVLNILLHSAETHGNKIDLNLILLTRGLAYNPQSKNFQTVANNFTGHSGNKLRKILFGENTIALIDATGYSFEKLVNLALAQPQYLDVLYSDKVIGYAKEGKLTREKFARVIAAQPKDTAELEGAIDFVSNEGAQSVHHSEEDPAEPEVVPVASGDDDDDGHSLANSTIYGGQLIRQQQEEPLPAAIPEPAPVAPVVAEPVVAARAPSPIPPAAQSTMIAGAAYSGTNLQTGASSSTSSATVVSSATSTVQVVQPKQHYKRTKRGGKAYS